MLSWALASISSLTISTCPSNDALISGVQPCCEMVKQIGHLMEHSHTVPTGYGVQLMLTLEARSLLTADTSPLSAASYRAFSSCRHHDSAWITSIQYTAKKISHYGTVVRSHCSRTTVLLRCCYAVATPYYGGSRRPATAQYAVVY